MRTISRARPVLGPLTAALLAASLLIAVGAIALHDSSQALRHDAQARVESNRNAVVRAVTRQAADLKATMAAFAEEPGVITALVTHRAGPAESQLRTLALGKHAPAVVLSDLTGRNLAIYPPQPGFIGADFSQRDWFQGAQRTGKPYISKAYRSVISGHPLVVGVTSPVVQGSTRVGYLTIIGQLASLNAVADGVRADDGVTITITDQTGQPLTGRPANTKNTLHSTAPVDGIGWTVTAALPTDVALAPLRGFRAILALSLGASLLVLLLSTIVATRATRRRAVEHEAVEVERARLTTLFAASPIGILECLPDSRIISCNDAMAAMLGYLPEDLVGTLGTDLVEPEAIPQVDADLASVVSGDAEGYRRERLYRAKDGSLVPAQVNVIVQRRGGEVQSVVAFLVDQRDQKRIESALRASEDRLSQLALHDDLTGLPNRRLLFARCTKAFEQARGAGVDGTVVAALFVDLDGFKPINDVCGHETGDQLLIDIAAALRAAMDPADTVARVGGDEFVILLDRYQGQAHLETVAQRTTSAVRRQLGHGASALRVTASVGVATIDVAIEPDARPDQLLSRADTAMYLAKEHGRDRHESFRGRMSPPMSPPLLPPVSLPDPRQAPASLH